MNLLIIPIKIVLRIVGILMLIPLSIVYLLLVIYHPIHWILTGQDDRKIYKEYHEVIGNFLGRMEDKFDL